VSKQDEDKSKVSPAMLFFMHASTVVSMLMTSAGFLGLVFYGVWWLAKADENLSKIPVMAETLEENRALTIRARDDGLRMIEQVERNRHNLEEHRKHLQTRQRYGKVD
jgi:hypothetical protein